MKAPVDGPPEVALDDGISEALSANGATGSLAGDAEESGQDEYALIRSAQQGDRDAFDHLVRNHDRGVLKLAMNLLRSSEDARDAYQEAFLKAYRNLGSFRFDCSFGTWIHKIASNVCFDQLRRRRVRTEVPSVVTTFEGEIDRTETAPEVRALGDPERILRNRQIERRIGTALEDLSPRERMIFELRHYDGLRLRKIGQITGTTEEAARNCLFRATRKLRAALGDFV